MAKNSVKRCEAVWNSAKNTAKCRKNSQKQWKTPKNTEKTR